MASLIWLDVEEDDILFNARIDFKSIITNRTSVGYRDRHIIAKGNVLEGREGK